MMAKAQDEMEERAGEDSTVRKSGDRAQAMKVEMVDLTCRTAPYDAHLARALGRQGVDVRLWISGCLPAQRDALEDVELARTYKLSERWKGFGPTARKVLKALEYPVNLCRLVVTAIQSRSDIVHFQWLPAPAGLTPLEHLALRVLRAWGVGVVLTVHDIDPGLFTTDELRSLSRLAGAVNRMICHTDSARERLCLGYGIDERKVAVVPHGPLGGKAARREREAARDRVGFGTDVVHGLFFGRLERYKGVEFLIDAWSRLDSEMKDQAVMHIVGKASPAYRRAVEHKIAAEGVGESVTTRFEYVTEDELADYVAAADFCVFPYRAITQSGAAMYALGAGKPVIATKVGGLKEVLEDGESALLVEYGAAQRWAAAMGELVRDEGLRERLGRGANQSARDRYGWGRSAQQTRSLYSACRDEIETP